MSVCLCLSRYISEGEACLKYDYEYSMYAIKSSCLSKRNGFITATAMINNPVILQHKSPWIYRVKNVNNKYWDQYQQLKMVRIKPLPTVLTILCTLNLLLLVQ